MGKEIICKQLGMTKTFKQKKLQMIELYFDWVTAILVIKNNKKWGEKNKEGKKLCYISKKTE